MPARRHRRRDAADQRSDPADDRDGARLGGADRRAADVRHVRGDGAGRDRTEPLPGRLRCAARRPAQRRAPDDGRWTWRYDLFGPWPEGAGGWTDFTPLWDDVGAITVPVLFVRGGESRYVRDEDVAEMRRRLPGIRVEVVPGAGHAVQSDRPLELAHLIEECLRG